VDRGGPGVYLFFLFPTRVVVKFLHWRDGLGDGSFVFVFAIVRHRVHFSLSAGITD